MVTIPVSCNCRTSTLCRFLAAGLAGGLFVANGVMGQPGPPVKGAATIAAVAFAGVERTAVAAADAEERRRPLGRAGPKEPLAFRLTPGNAVDDTTPIAWRLWIDFDRDGVFSRDELVHETTGAGVLNVVVALSEIQRAGLHSDVPRTLPLRVAVALPPDSGKGEPFLPQQIYNFSLIFDARTPAVRPIRLESGVVPGSDQEAGSVHIETGRHHVVQLARLPTGAERKILRMHGVVLLGYLPERSWWARVDASREAVLALRVAGGVVFAEPASATLKLQPGLAAGREKMEGGEATVEVAVHWFPDATRRRREGVRAEHRDLDWTNFSNAGYAVLRGSPDRIAALAADESVQWIERHVSETKVHSSVGNLDHHVVPLMGAPYYLNSPVVPVAIFDAGWVDAKHPDLAGRVGRNNPDWPDTFGRPIGNTTTVGDHATHMAGVIGSSGAHNALAQGTAPSVNILSYREAENYRNVNALALQESRRFGWRVANHSYGSGFPCGPTGEEPCKSSPRWTSYISQARDVDTWAYQYGVLSVFSAGNDGVAKNEHEGWENDNWSTIYSGGAGKNVIAACAASRSDYLETRFFVRPDSSKGPASDGRVKPDLCAEGGGSNRGPAWTTDLGGGYATTNSTSEAAAQITGIVALLQEQYRRLLTGTPTASPPAMPPALARAVLIQTAEDMEHIGTRRWDGNRGAFLTSNTFAGPDYTTGWGFADAQAAVDTLRARWRYRSQSVGQDGKRFYDVKVPAGDVLKVTLAWDDPPATAGAASALVNDLDLDIKDTTTRQIYFPWVLEKRRPMEPATTGINTVDNVEQVVLTNRSSTLAVYRITVRGTSVPQGPQSFHIVSNFAIIGPP